MFIKLVEKIRGQKLNKKGMQAMKRLETILFIIVVIIVVGIGALVLAPKFFTDNKQEVTSNSKEASALKGTDFSERDNSWKQESEIPEIEQTAEPAKAESKEESKEVTSIPTEVQARVPTVD